MSRLIEPLLEFALGCAIGVTLTLLLIDAILRTEPLTAMVTP